MWHFYPSRVPGTYPVEPKDQWKLAYPATPKAQKAIPWKTPKEAPPPTDKNTVTIDEKTIVLHVPAGATDQAQMLIPTLATGQVSGLGPGYYNNCTYNFHNTYNYAGPVHHGGYIQETAAQVEPEPEPEREIQLTEDDVKMDAMLHEQVQALHQLHYLHTVDYGAGDVYGRRYVRQ